MGFTRQTALDYSHHPLTTAYVLQVIVLSVQSLESVVVYLDSNLHYP